MLILGAPGRQGGMCGEMRMFLDSLAPLQVERKGNSCGVLKVTWTPAIFSIPDRATAQPARPCQQITALIHCNSRQEHDHAPGVHPLPQIINSLEEM